MKLIVDNIDTQIVYEEADKHLKPVIDKELHVGIGIKDEDAKYSRLYRNGIWDGIVKFYDEENSRFPSGLVDQVDTILGHLQNKFPFQYTIVDDRPDVFLTLEDVDEEIVLDDEEVGTITLRDYQYESVKSAVEDQVGIVNVATNGGKTEIASGFIQQIRPYLERGETIAFFTSSTAIFNQSAVRLSERLGGLPIGKYGGGKKDIKQVNVVMIPTISTALKVDPEANLKFSPKEMIIKKLAKLSPQFQKGVNQKRMLEAYLRNFQVITQADSRYAMEIQMILDTCGTDSQVKMKLRNYEAEYQKLIEKKNGDVLKKYNEAKEFLESVAVMIVDEAHHTSSDTWYTSLRMCTNARYRLALTGSIDKRNKVLWQRMQAVFHDTVIKTSNEELINLGHSAKPTITMVPIGAPRGIEGKKDYQEVYRLGIVENEYRNSIITGVTAKKYREGKGVLVIVNYVEHGEMLSEQLDKMQVDHFFLHGELPVEEREEKLQDMREGRLKVLIATSLVDEGVDISGIDALVLGAGGKSMRQVLQRVGRALRKKKQGENVTYIYDFDDRTHEYLRKHTKERRNIYLAENFDVVDLNV